MSLGDHLAVRTDTRVQSVVGYVASLARRYTEATCRVRLQTDEAEFAAAVKKDLVFQLEIAADPRQLIVPEAFRRWDVLRSIPASNSCNCRVWKGAPSPSGGASYLIPLHDDSHSSLSSIMADT